MKINKILLALLFIHLSSLAQDFSYFSRANISVGNKTHRLATHVTQDINYTFGGGFGLEGGIESQMDPNLGLYCSLGYQQIMAYYNKSIKDVSSESSAFFNRKFITLGANLTIVKLDSLDEVSIDLGFSYHFPGELVVNQHFNEYNTSFDPSAGFHFGVKYRKPISDIISVESGVRLRVLDFKEQASEKIYNSNGTELSISLIYKFKKENTKI